MILYLLRISRETIRTIRRTVSRNTASCRSSSRVDFGKFRKAGDNIDSFHTKI